MRSRLIVPAAVFSLGMVAALAPAAYADQETDGSGGVGSGNQVNVPTDVEAELCGNSLAALGISQAECTEIAETLYAADTANGDSSGGQSSDGSGGVASGNQINIPVDVALDICGNSAAVGGISQAECTEVVTELEESEENEDSGGQSSDGSGGVASGNQINIPVDLAVNVCGNAISVLGISQAECTEVVTELEESEENEDSGGQSSDGSGGVASGNQVSVPVDAAVEICGNAVSVLGIAEAECQSQISDEDDNGKDDEDEDDNGKDDDDEYDNGKDDEDEDDEKPEADEATTPDHEDADDSLPVTGAALGGLVAAAVAALGLGGLIRYFMGKSRASVEPTV